MTLQSKTIESVLANLGLKGFKGITALKDGGDATILNITVAAGAWAVLGDGTTFFYAELLLATPLVIPGNNVNAAAVTCWLDVNAAGAPVFSVLTGTTNPSTSAIAIDAFVVAGNVITTHTAAATGLPKPASFPAWS